MFCYHVLRPRLCLIIDVRSLLSIEIFSHFSSFQNSKHTSISNTNIHVMRKQSIISLVLIGSSSLLLEGYQPTPVGWQPAKPFIHTLEDSAVFVATVPRQDPSQQSSPIRELDPRLSTSPTESIRHVQTYNLGLGKNLPVRSHRAVITENEDDVRTWNVEEVTRHWNDHLATQSFPSPLLQDSADADNAGTTSQSTTILQNQKFLSPSKLQSQSHKQKMGLIIPQRRMDDVLFIRVDQEQPRDPSSSCKALLGDTSGASRTFVKTKKTSTTTTTSTLAVASVSATRITVPTIMSSKKSSSQQWDVNSIWVEMLLHQQQQEHQQELLALQNH
jgi:hypothetical protein